MKKIVLLLITLMLLGCSSLKPFEDEEFNLPTGKTENEDLLAVESVDDARSKAKKAAQADKIDLAQAYYGKAYSMEPDNIPLLQEMARFYKTINNNELVKLCYQLILKETPEDYQTIEQYGLLLIRLKRYSKAKTLLMKVLDADTEKKNWRVLNALGLIEDLQGDYKQAILYFEQALKIKPEQVDVINNIGFSLYRSNKYKEALSFYKKGLKINSKHKKTLFNYALLTARTKKYDEAIAIFSQLMSVAEANNNVGYIAMKNGDLMRAEYHLKRASTLSTRYYKKANENLKALKALKK